MNDEKTTLTAKISYNGGKTYACRDYTVLFEVGIWACVDISTTDTPVLWTTRHYKLSQTQTTVTAPIVDDDIPAAQLTAFFGTPMPMAQFAAKQADFSTQATNDTNGHEATKTNENALSGLDSALLLKQLSGTVSVFSDFADYVVTEQSALVGEIATLLDENWALFTELGKVKTVARESYAALDTDFKNVSKDLQIVRTRRDKWKAVAINTEQAAREKLTTANETIIRQAAEIERLQEQLRQAQADAVAFEREASDLRNLKAA